MKINKTSLVLAITGAVIITGFIFGMNTVKQADAKQALQTQLTLARQKLSLFNDTVLVNRQNSLTTQLDQYNSKIAGQQTKLAYAKDSIDTTAALLADAQACNVNIIDLSSPGLSTQTLAGTRCTIIQLSLSVNGNINDIAAFVYSLATVFPTSTVQSVQFAVTGAATPAPDALNPDGSAAVTTATPAPSGTPAPSPPASRPAASPAPPAGPNATNANISLTIYNYAG